MEVLSACLDKLILDNQPLITQAVGEFLEARVQSMVDECNRKSRKGTADPKKAPPLPLVRLRVDYTGFSTINSQRFGQKFVGKVANPQDVLHWHKAAAKKTSKVVYANN